MITIDDINWARRVGELQGELKELGAPRHILTYIEAWVHEMAYKMGKQQEEELKEATK